MPTPIPPSYFYIIIITITIIIKLIYTFSYRSRDKRLFAMSASAIKPSTGDNALMIDLARPSEREQQLPTNHAFFRNNKTQGSRPVNS